MTAPLLERVKHVHMIGIGGIGVSALAELLMARGVTVSGSDREDSSRLARLEDRGAEVHVGHSAELIVGADLVVASAAIPEDNAELAAARYADIEILRRGELLAEMTRGRKLVAVAGAHGKTTTTAMLARILVRTGQDPTVVLGGDSQDIDGNARLGRGEWVVVEADESDGSFLLLEPAVAVITNVDPEHLDYWKTAEQYSEAFTEFAGRVGDHGTVVLCSDDPALARLGEQLGSRATSFGLHSDARYTAESLCIDADGAAFTALLDGSEIGRLALEAPGEHGVVDGLAALAAAIAVGIEPANAASGLDGYRGVARRFQKLGQVGEVQVIDDYAHHPAEITATLDAARAAFPGNRLIAAFQPHLYSRTRDHLGAFAMALCRADRVLVTGIYAAREAPIPGVSGEAIVAEMELRGGPPAYSEEQREAVAPHLARMARPGDVILLLGAGDIWKSGEELLKLLRKTGGSEEEG